MPVSFTLNRSTALHTDADGDGVADAGDVLRHILTIHNTGTTDATAVVLSDLLGGSTETGTVNISPIAFNDVFDAVGNTLLEVGNATGQTGPQTSFAGNILGNDIGSTTVGAGALAGDDVPGFSISALQATAVGGSSVTATSDHGGAVTLITTGVDAGSFTYVSAAGFQGDDTFTYTIKDAGIDGIAGNGDDTSSTATVTIHVTGQVWYVTGGGSDGDGTSTNPFNTLTHFAGAGGVDGANDYIYAQGTTTGNLTMEASEHLIGTGSALIVNGLTLAAAGSNSTLGASSGTVVTLGTDNDVEGITINANGAGVVGMADNNGSVTTAGVGAAHTFTASHISFTGTGQAVDIDQGGTLNVSIDSLTSSGSSGQGVQLSGTATSGTGLLSGTFTVAGGAISGSAGAGFLIGDGTVGHGGTIAVSDAGTIAKSTAGAVVDVEGHTGGAVTFSGTITTTGAVANGILVNNNSGGSVTFSGANDTLSTGAGNAVSLTSNTGATIDFTGGGLNLTTTSGAGFNATGGGTITVTGSNNSIHSGAGTALNVNNTTIGSNDLNFHDISASSGSNGIVFSSTGALGGLNVTGSGTTDGSGGTIQNTSGRGASFIDSVNIHIQNMNFTNAGTSDLDSDNSGLSTGDNLATNAAINLVNVTNATIDNVNISGGAEQGINGNNVTNFSLLNSTISGVGNGPDEDGIHFYNMSGSSRISNTQISGSGDDNVDIQTQSGNLDLDISGAGNSANGSLQGSGYLFGIRGTSVANINLDGVTSSNNFSGGIVADAFDNATMNIRVNGSTVSNNNDGISLSGGQSSNVDAVITGNTVTSTTPTLDFAAINLLGAAFSTSSAVFDAQVSGNIINIASGVTADGMTVFNAGGGQLNLGMFNNTINYAGTQRAVLVQAGQDGNGATTATIQSNTINMQNSGALANPAILVQTAITGPPAPDNTSSIDLSLGGAGALANTFNHPGGGTIAGGDIRVRQRFDGTINLDGYGGNGSDTTGIINYLNGRNNEVSSSTATLDGTTPHPYTGNATDAFISVSVSAPSVAENGATNLIYTFTRSGSTAASLVVGFDTIGTASSASDFTVTGVTSFSGGHGTVTFAAGSATATITVDPTADAIAEADESVVVVVTDTATVSGSFGRALISNDDSPLFLSATAPGNGSSTGGAHGDLVPTPPTRGPALVQFHPTLFTDMLTPHSWARPIGVDDGFLSRAELNLIVGTATHRWPAFVQFDPTPPTDPVTAPSSAQPIVVDDGVLSQAELNLIVGAAIDRWAAAGASAEEITAMKAVVFTVEDLHGLTLGSSTAGHVTLDTNAAGFSWFIDATPGEDGEYKGQGTDLRADPSSTAGVRIDLLTTVMHELGHQIGLGDSTGSADRADLMYGTIDPGERRLPDGQDVASATGTPNAGTDFALSPIGLGTIPAGQTVTVQWDSTVNAFTNQIIPTFNNTSSVSGSNFATVTSNVDAIGPTTTLALDSVTLGDRVFLDANNNGLFDGADTGVNGVALTLFADTNANGVFDGGDTQIATTTTAGGGLYSFANLAPGNYIVRVDASNFTGVGVLVSRPAATGGSDPDNDVATDSNGVTSGTLGAGGFVVSQTITLSQNGEVTADGTGHLDINNTLDFGFVPLNQAPVNTKPGTQTINEDATLTFTGGTAISVNDVDVGGGNLTVTLTVLHGTLTLGGGIGSLAFTTGDGTGDTTMTFSGTQANVNAALNGLTYQPIQDYNGSDTLTITTNDNGNTGADPGLTGGPNDEQDVDTVTINITAVADIANDSVTPTEDTPATLNLLANDSFENAGRTITSVTQGAHGLVTINDNGNGPGSDDFVVYTPNADYNGADSFTYTVTSGGVTETATVTVTVGAVADIVNDSPTINEDTATNVMVLGNDTFEGTPAITNVGAAAHGTAVLNNHGTPADTTDDFIVYTPNADYNGSDSFTYTVTSGGVAETATVNVTINPVADIANDSVAVAQDSGSNSLNLLANDTFESAGRTITSVTQGAHGTVAINQNGNGPGSDDFVTFTPAAGYMGPDSFTYTVTSGGVTETATVTVNVTGPDATPVVDLNGAGGGIDNAASYTENDVLDSLAPILTVADADNANIASATVRISAGLIPNFDYLEVNGGTNGSIGAISFNYSSATGILTLTGSDTLANYEAVLRQVGFESTSDTPGASRTIVWTINDGTLDSATATTTLTVTSVDDPAVARPDAVTTDEATPILNGNVLLDNGSGPDSDPDGPPLSVSAVNGSGANVGTPITLASGAHLTLNANGTFAYDPNHAFDATPAAGSGASNTPAHDSFTYTLTGGGTATVTVTVNGLDSNDLLFGTAGVDNLNGGIGSDVLIGGLGADTMTGGTGDDIYVVDNAGDVLFEAPGEGTDQVYSSTDYVLAAGASVEILAVDDYGATTPINLTGNEFGQQLIGNAGDNILSGGGAIDALYGLGGNDILNGGTGADYMVGGTGNDVYAVDGGDVIVEAAGEGIDQVYTSSSYALAAGVSVEILAVNDYGATTPINLAGNEFAQTLLGNAGDNSLSAGGGIDALYGLGGNDILNGGTGADYMVGGTGNDIYAVDAGDVIVEAAGEGFDQVYTSVSYVLAAGVSIETLSVADYAATSAINLTGNDFAQQLFGNAGANVLNGGGGPDDLVGGGGADTFQFTTPLGIGNVDTIEDFLSGTDTIALDDVVFTAIGGLGALNPNAFVVGTQAGDADDRIIYDQATGNLYYDADGNGAGAAVQFATLTNHPVITANDFTVI